MYVGKLILVDSCVFESQYVSYFASCLCRGDTNVYGMLHILSPPHRYQLSEEGEWLVNELDIEVEREENGSVSLQELRRISRLASQW